jgi:hypothetical protein
MRLKGGRLWNIQNETFEQNKNCNCRRPQDDD